MIRNRDKRRLVALNIAAGNVSAAELEALPTIERDRLKLLAKQARRQARRAALEAQVLQEQRNRFAKGSG